MRQATLQARYKRGGAKMRFLYISSGLCGPDEPLSKFRLIPRGWSYGESDMVRVCVSDDVCIEFFNGYYTANDNRPVRDFDPVVVARFNTKLRVDADLTQKWMLGLQPHQFHEVMHERGYKGAVRFGYLNADQYAFYRAHVSTAYQIRKIPKDTKNFDGFWKAEDYAAHAMYIDAVRKIMQDDEYAPLRNMSDKQIMDMYGVECFFHTCGNRLKDLPDCIIKDILDNHLEWWNLLST